jgi:hypothetical protein
MLRKPIQPNLSAITMGIFEPGAANQFAEIAIARVALNEQEQSKWSITILVIGNPDISTKDWFDSCRTRRLIKLNVGKGIGKIGNRKGWLPVICCLGDCCI